MFCGSMVRECSCGCGHHEYFLKVETVQFTNSYFTTECFAESVPAEPHLCTPRYETILTIARRGSTYILSYCMTCSAVHCCMCQRYRVRSGRTTAPYKDRYRHCLMYDGVPSFQATVLQQILSTGKQKQPKSGSFTTKKGQTLKARHQYS